MNLYLGSALAGHSTTDAPAARIAVKARKGV
jgi:hypothetical protein